jgi:lipid-A-disaccharide synthase
VKPPQFMLIAGEASGDMLGAELIAALRAQLTERGASFFGVGGPRMQAAGMELIFDFTGNAVWGLEAIKQLWEFRRRFQQLLKLAIERKPDAIICVDFAGFNRSFAHAIREHTRNSGSNWNPKIIQYVSPQVWASRPGRADKMARDIDLLLAIFPFEKAWYAKRTPQLRVEFVGHPMIDRYASALPARAKEFSETAPLIVLLPGSRPTELKKHLPIFRETVRLIRAARADTRAVVVLSDRLAALARQMGLPENVEVQSNLHEALARADLAIAKSGTVTLECAYFGVPTVVLYKTSAITYEIGIRIVQVKWAAMPNILANEEVFPEFLQYDATPPNIARAALELMGNTARRTRVQEKLRDIRASLGTPGASGRAAREIIKLMGRGLLKEE